MVASSVVQSGLIRSSPITHAVLGQDGSGFLSWRWGCKRQESCFRIDFLICLPVYINLPVCLVALLVLIVSLRNVHLGDTPDASWRALVEKFDFGGLYVFPLSILTPIDLLSGFYS